MRLKSCSIEDAKDRFNNSFFSLILFYLKVAMNDNTNLYGWYPSTNGIIARTAYDSNSTAEFGKYYFRVKPDYNLIHAVSMSQNLSFENYTLLISSGNARYNLSAHAHCFGNQYVNVEISFADFNGLRYKPAYLSKICKNDSTCHLFSVWIHF